VHVVARAVIARERSERTLDALRSRTRRAGLAQRRERPVRKRVGRFDRDAALVFRGGLVHPPEVIEDLRLRVGQRGVRQHARLDVGDQVERAIELVDQPKVLHEHGAVADQLRGLPIRAHDQLEDQLRFVEGQQAARHVRKVARPLAANGIRATQCMLARRAIVALPFFDHRHAQPHVQAVGIGRKQGFVDRFGLERTALVLERPGQSPLALELAVHGIRVFEKIAASYKKKRPPEGGRSFVADNRWIRSRTAP
jgi:hypothetical protein